MGDLGFELKTVDSVQGREKDVVILLTTKTKFSQDPEGEFINDYRRLNVAATRSRHGQFIVGQASTLRQVPVWNTLLRWADSINVVVTAAAERGARGRHQRVDTRFSTDERHLPPRYRHGGHALATSIISHRDDLLLHVVLSD
ncbi:hypothetical protein V3C99_000561 [Haemonchus contortus]